MLLGSVTVTDMEEFKESVVLADGSVTGYKQLDAPSGEHYKLGNSQADVIQIISIVVRNNFKS